MFATAPLLLSFGLIATGPIEDEVYQRIQSVQKQLESVLPPSEPSPDQFIRILSNSLRDIEWIRRTSINRVRGKFFRDWTHLEDQWIQILQGRLENSVGHPLRGVQLFEILRRSEISIETRDRIARRIDGVPPHPDHVARFLGTRNSWTRAFAADFKIAFLRERFQQSGLSIWISVPSLDVEDHGFESESGRSRVPADYSLFGFQAEDPPPRFSDLELIDVWILNAEKLLLMTRLDRETLDRIERQQPKTMREWMQTADLEYKLSHFSPGEHIINRDPDGKVRTVRWDSTYSVDDLISDDPLLPTLWFSFQRAPRNHYEPRSVRDPLPRLWERGGFSIFSDSKGITPPILHFTTDEEYHSFERRLSNPPQSVGDLLLAAFGSHPHRYAKCGEWLKLHRLIPDLPSPPSP